MKRTNMRSVFFLLVSDGGLLWTPSLEKARNTTVNDTSGAIIGRHGYLAAKQHNVKHLTLCTSPWCQINVELETKLRSVMESSRKAMMDLAVFNCLESLTWRYVDNFIALRRCLRAHAPSLINLRIEMQNTHKSVFIRHAFYEDDLLVDGILRLIDDGQSIFLWALSTLYLRGLPLMAQDESDFESSLVRKALNVRYLDRLSLIHCRSVGSFLARLDRDLKKCKGKSPRAYLRLQRLEVVTRPSISDDDAAEEGPIQQLVAALLDRCPKLEDLWLLVRQEVHEPGCDCAPSKSPKDLTKILWSAIKNRRDKLKRLIYHELECGEDCIEHMISAKIGPIIGSLNLEYLGICDTPGRIRGYLSRSPYRSSLKLLHIRRTAEIESHPIRKVYLPSSQTHVQDLLCGVRDKQSHENWKTSSFFDLVWAPTAPIQPPPGATAYKNLLKLVDWAFSPRGLPNIELIAFGDFSNDGRYRDQTLLFRPVPSPPKSRSTGTPTASSSPTSHPNTMTSTPSSSSSSSTTTAKTPSPSPPLPSPRHRAFEEIPPHNPAWSRIQAPYYEFLSACPERHALESKPRYLNSGGPEDDDDDEDDYDDEDEAYWDSEMDYDYDEDEELSEEDDDEEEEQEGEGEAEGEREGDGDMAWAQGLGAALRDAL
ncbi:MAG: hypothetical protein Q9227_005208 [Pyrenula ochraceoflavens]